METHHAEVEQQVRTALNDLYLPEGVELWLHSPNSLLNHRRPLDLIEAGYGDEVLAAIESIATGGL